MSSLPGAGFNAALRTAETRLSRKISQELTAATGEHAGLPPLPPAVSEDMLDWGHAAGSSWLSRPHPPTVASPFEQAAHFSVPPAGGYPQAAGYGYRLPAPAMPQHPGYRFSPPPSLLPGGVQGYGHVSPFATTGFVPAPTRPLPPSGVGRKRMRSVSSASLQPATSFSPVKRSAVRSTSMPLTPQKPALKPVDEKVAHALSLTRSSTEPLHNPAFSTRQPTADSILQAKKSIDAFRRYGLELSDHAVQREMEDVSGWLAEKAVHDFYGFGPSKTYLLQDAKSPNLSIFRPDSASKKRARVVLPLRKQDKVPTVVTNLETEFDHQFQSGRFQIVFDPATGAPVSKYQQARALNYLP